MAGRLVLKDRPTLADLQAYIAAALVDRGHNDEPLYAMLMLTEEVGELAKAVRKAVGGKTDPESRIGHTADELADILWVLLAICNKFGIDLEQAFREKEEKNKRRMWQ